MFCTSKVLPVPITVTLSSWEKLHLYVHTSIIQMVDINIDNKIIFYYIEYPGWKGAHDVKQQIALLKMEKAGMLKDTSTTPLTL